MWEVYQVIFVTISLLYFKVGLLLNLFFIKWMIKVYACKKSVASLELS